MELYVLLQGIIKLKNTLPVISTFLEALSLPHKHNRELLKAGLPLIIAGVLLIIFNHILPGTEGGGLKKILSIILYIGLFLSAVIATVACHRIFLLDNDVVGESGLFSWTGNEIIFLGWWMFIGLAVILFAIPLLLITIPVSVLFSEIVLVEQIVSYGAAVPLYYVASRLSLVLPSSAIDIHGKSFRWSWGISSGNGWRLTLLIGFIPFFANFLFGLLPDFDSIIFKLFQGALWLVVGVVQIGLLSLSYKFLVSNESGDNTPEEIVHKDM